jgi:steroid delta-isomerase-like uncharacterized protein
MSAEQNKSIVRRWIENGWNRGNVSLIDDLYTSNVVQYDPSTPVEVKGSEALKQYVTAFLTALPDLQFTIEDLVAEGDKVVWRFSSHGTHQGPLMGIPATGRTATVTGMVLFRLENSKIAEVWVNIDTLGMLEQMGVIPMPNA